MIPTVTRSDDRSLGADTRTRILAAPALTRFLVVTVRADLAHDAFLIQLLLQPAQGLVHGLTLPDLDFSHG